MFIIAKKRKKYIKIKLSNNKTRKLYRHPKEFRTKKQANKQIKKLKELHRAWNRKIVYRIQPEKNKWNEKISVIYMHSTEPNFMEGFRGSR